MTSLQLLMTQVTDQYGHVEAEPLVVRVEGQHAFLELEDGRSVLVDVRELRAALGSGQQEQAA